MIDQCQTSCLKKCEKDKTVRIIITRCIENVKRNHICQKHQRGERKVHDLYGCYHHFCPINSANFISILTLSPECRSK
jgi:hypothetical protein